jgi:putative endonuclease
VTQTARQGLGAAGERLARRHLEGLGYQYVAANWHCRSGELDLVMLDGEVLVFVEVKTRHGERFGVAEETVTAAQARRLTIAAQQFLEERPEFQDRIWRIDLVAVTLASSGATRRLSHLQNVIDWP